MLRRAVPAAALIAPLFFGACGERAAEPETEAAAPAAADPDPLAPDAPLPAPAMIEASYDCTPAMALSVKYDNTVDPPKAVVTLDGRIYDMTLAPSGSGARYITASGRSPGMTLVWWNKGNDGMLQEGKGATSDDEKTIATCTGKPS
jgi:membrane-bound inhibitor of C-type lysozyme